MYKDVTNSIQNSVNFAFNHASGNPNITQMAQTMFRAARSGTLPFDILIREIIVNGTGKEYIHIIDMELNIFVRSEAFGDVQ